MADGGYPNKIKRPCLEDVTLPVGHPSTSCAELQVPPLSMNPSPVAMGVAGPSLLLDNDPMNGSVLDASFTTPSTTEMALKGPTVPNYEKTNSMPGVDQELQDLLEELTKIQEPSPSELDLEKILGSKPEEPLVLQNLQVNLGTTAKPTVHHMAHLESLGSSKDFASSCSQVPSTSLPMPLSSTDLSYSIPSTSKHMISPSSSTAETKNQVQAMLPVTLSPLQAPQWHHAHQLKALAASKQGSATKHQALPPTWSGLPPPGLSPPYRPVPSPHPPPPPPPPRRTFSPQSLTVSCMAPNSLQGSSLQGSPDALLSSMVPSSSATLGRPVPYTAEKLPSPALNQQQQFTPQSSILANLVRSTIKSPQGHLMSALPTSTLGPSPPYRSEKLASPGLPQQSFTSQCSRIQNLTPTGHLPSAQQPANPIFKPMTSSSSKTLSMGVQQGLVNASPGAPEPFTFANTKPLSHFVSEPAPQKIPPMPATCRQPSLLHYLQQPTQAQASPASASSSSTVTFQQQLQPQPQPKLQSRPQPDQSSFLLQQVMQQTRRFQRPVASDPAPALPRQGSHWSAKGLLPSCSTCPSGSWPTLTYAAETERPTLVGRCRVPPAVCSVSRATGTQPAEQEKQRSGLMAMTPEQQSEYIAQQMSQFQAVQEQVTSKHSQPKASPKSKQHTTPPASGLLQNRLTPGMAPPTKGPSPEGTSAISPALGRQQGTVHSRSQPPIPSHADKNPLDSLGSAGHYLPSPQNTSQGVPLPGFSPDALGSQSMAPHQLGQPSGPRTSAVFHSIPGVPVAPAVITAVSREKAQSQVGNSMQQHLGNNWILAQAPRKMPPGAPMFPSQQLIVLPNQMALEGRPGQKVTAALDDSSFNLLSKQSHWRSPVPMLATTAASFQQGMTSFESPARGMAPPSYVAASAATTAAKAASTAAKAASTATASQCPGPLNRGDAHPELPSEYLLPQPQPPVTNLLSPPARSDVDVIEALLKGSSMSLDEDWLCNLRLIDDILEQHATAQNATVQKVCQLPEDARGP